MSRHATSKKWLQREMDDFEAKIMTQILRADKADQVIIKKKLSKENIKRANTFEAKMMERILVCDEYKIPQFRRIRKKYARPVKVAAKSVNFDKVAQAASKVTISGKDKYGPPIDYSVRQKIDRVPAEYSNKSPYGIWTEMANEQLKES